MLKSEQKKQNEFDPFLNIFEEGMDQFVHYQRQSSEEYKTRAQKHKDKIAKLQRDLNDPQLKKQRNRERRQAQKAKLRQVIDSKTPQQMRQFHLERKLKKQEQKNKVKNAMLTGQVMMLDLVYEDKMNNKENKSLAKQIQLIMKAIKHIDEPPSIHLCSFQGGIKTQLQKMGYQHLPMTVHSQNIIEVGQKLGKRLVYLSPDAELPLQTIENDTAYILGGLIDRTILKNASLMRANELGLQTRKLPIRQYMKSRIVLNLDHVVMMVCKYKQVNDWKAAFDFAAPKRWKKEEGPTANKSQSQQEQEKCQNKYICEEKQQIKEDPKDN